MITAGVRRSALGTFPPGTPLAIVAPAASAFAEIVRERNDPAVAYRALDAQLQVPAQPYLLLEGVDDVADPAAFLRDLRAALPSTRLFALIANGGHLPALGAFFGGRPLARAHPFTRSDVEPLLAAAGWKPLGVVPIEDPTLAVGATAPIALTVGAITFNCADQATLERARIAAFLVIADAA